VRGTRALRRAAFVVAAATALVVACGGESGERGPVSPPRSSPTFAVATDAGVASADAAPAGNGNAGGEGGGAPDAARAQATSPELRTSRMGPGPLEPGAGQGFSLVVSTKAMRASASGKKLARTFSLTRSVMEMKAKTGVDPFDEGDLLFVYGPHVSVFVANVNVVRHHAVDAEVARATASAGWPRSDAGSPAYDADLFGVRSVLLVPAPHTVALVPVDRAADLVPVLARVTDPKLGPGEVARAVMAEPNVTLARIVLPSVKKLDVVLRPAQDGGLDVAGEGACTTPEACTLAARAVLEEARQHNSLAVRIATRGLFNDVKTDAQGTKLRIGLHATPDQVDALVGLVRAALDVPAVDPSDNTHR